ncbi:MAG: helix-turn-helix domain-containing protein [Bacteroidales bacterium]|nr:helix-turn-helix domain-containing protein [Bacteroidales bacterium]
MRKILETQAQLKKAIKRLEFLTDKEEISSISDLEEMEIEYLSVLIEEFEEKHSPIEPPNPVEYLKYILEHKNMKQQDLANLLGISKGTLSNILNYRKKLSIEMIRALHKHLGISYDILMEDYELQL